MFKPFSSINSKRTSQDVLNILRQGSVKERMGAQSVSSGRENHSNDAHTDPVGIGFLNSVEKTGLQSANLRKPGLRLGLKRVVMKTMGDEPPSKKERGSVPLPNGTRCFSVLFAKPQTKKNKTWENDGYLLLKDASLTLKNHQGDLITCGRLVHQVLEEGHHFSVGDKIVQIQEELFEMPSVIS